MADRLKDKVAVVVGAGSIGPGWGNGKATAVAFAREGAKVFCVDINLAAAEETANIITGEGGLALPFRADVTKQRRRRGDGEGLRSRTSAASTCSTTMSASPRSAAWSNCPRRTGTACSPSTSRARSSP